MFGQLIAALIKLHSFKDVVEVGVFKGLTSSYMISNIAEGEVIPVLILKAPGEYG